jgi:integrase
MGPQKLIILPKLNNCSGSTDKQWFVYYSVRDPRSGKMVRIRHYDGFTGLSEEEKYKHASELISDYTRKLQSGWTPWADAIKNVYQDHLEYKVISDLYGFSRTKNRTLRDVSNQYLKYKQPGISHSTFQTYTSKLRVFALWAEKNKLKNNDITSYSHAIVLRFFKYLIETKKLSGKSIKYYTEIIRSFFTYCIDQKYFKKNPVYGIPKCTRINDNTPRPIMKEDVEAFKKEIQKDEQLWLCVQFMFYCGLRPNHEAREMKLKDIDLVAGCIYVARAAAKSRNMRVVTIPRQFLEYLRRTIDVKKWDREYYLFGRGGQPGPLPVGKNTLGRRFIEIRKNLSMPAEYKFYSWKHTGMVEADNTGRIPDKDISNHVGHSDLATTSIYFRNKKPAISSAIRDFYPDI